ncbi:Quinolinate synthase, chloroplastic [Sesamum angolense]|uniref:Quinolinate synthase, chloroplastic n=1 Tax=Sesamum angolense TaxID=2727404 RepID=A0AAE1T5M0_9LAMI|nr:Quinolinate synthase, chloroplastic [Sesamum angolense]
MDLIPCWNRDCHVSMSMSVAVGFVLSQDSVVFEPPPNQEKYSPTLVPRNVLPSNVKRERRGMGVVRNGIGMVTSIVAAVRKLLALSSLMMELKDFLKLPVIPGVASGEGCSLHGGCASCPYMKMNSLGSLLKVCRSLPHDKENLSAYEAGRFSLQTPNGNLIADVGCEPILHMRHFQATKRLPEKLIQQILRTNS